MNNFLQITTKERSRIYYTVLKVPRPFHTDSRYVEIIYINISDSEIYAKAFFEQSFKEFDP